MGPPEKCIASSTVSVDVNGFLFLVLGQRLYNELECDNLSSDIHLLIDLQVTSFIRLMSFGCRMSSLG